MSLQEDAEAFLKRVYQNKASDTSSDEILDIRTETQYVLLAEQLQKMYDNASKREIEKAINETLQTMEMPVIKSDFFKKIRIKLED